ncbi:MAG: NACHT domain-containing protein [Methylacidiphilales bacterium]|nr:NACHT domain-containing protein [Candidatus Methylacidiphilales bacterium]NJR20001.1 NACHT domain-containing protein [Calothrix sp. CSU_2_0]
MPLNEIISAIASFASPILKDKIQRNETVIKLLQQFKLNPEHPPADFSGVYAYALVEYGVGRPRELLEIFRHDEVKQAFRKAFDHNNPSILLSEVDTFLDTYSLGDEIRNLGVDVRREVAEFATVFIEVAKRSRTPGDVLMSHQLGSLHKRIASIQEQLSRLPNLEGIRTEIARLAGENYPALPGVSGAENNCKAIAIAQQMRGWFETLGYRFEKYEVWQDSYFEWIINIPVRRNRYDRILVRGIAGEAGLADVMALGQSVETQRTDEGWLITSRRISRAARNEVDKEENRHLGCYTFDELLAQDADFSGYLDWLEAEIKRRNIDTKYVPLACNKEEIDPISKRQIAVSRYDEQDGWIDGYIDRWLDDPAKEHISILGEFGTGKTWFALHYAWVTLQRYRDAQKRGTELPRLPLVIPLRDYAKAVSVESLFSEFFFRQYKIPLPHYDAFIQLNRMGKLLLIFDGFDEMAAKVDKQEMINNFWELAKVVVPGAKVILTCRTEHFPEAQEGRALLNAELQASTKDLTGETPQFEVLELEKFNDEQIQQVLSFQAAPATVEMVMGNPQLLDLARRPVMTELILEALPDIEAGKPVDMSRVYLYAVRHKMERDIKSDRTFTSLADKLYFLCELSWEMLSTDQMSLNYKFFPNRIRQGHTDWITSVAFHPQGNFVVTGSHDRRLMLWNIHDGQCVASFDAHSHRITCAKFNSQGNIIGSSSFDGTVRLWNTYTGECLQVLHCHKSTVFSIAFHPHNSLIASVGDDPTVKLWDINTGKCLKTFVQKGSSKIRSIAFHPNGKLLVCGSYEGYIFLLDANTGECINTLKHDASTVLSLAINPQGSLIASANSTVKLWDINTGESIITLLGHTNRLCSVSFSPDNTVVASGGDDHLVKLWNINTGKCTKILQGHCDWVNSVAHNPTGNLLASGSDNRMVKIWDTLTGECINTLEGHSSGINSVKFSYCGHLLASGSFDKTVRIWDSLTGNCLKILQGHLNTVWSIAFSPDDKYIASGSSDKTVKVWDIRTGLCIKTLQGHSNRIFSVAFSSQKNMIASSSHDEIRLWDIETEECVRILHGHTSHVLSVVFNSQGNLLLSGGDDLTLRLWDIYTGMCIKILEGHTGAIESVAFSSDDNSIISCDADGKIKLWDSKASQPSKK